MRMSQLAPASKTVQQQSASQFPVIEPNPSSTGPDSPEQDAARSAKQTQRIRFMPRPLTR